MNTEPHSVCAVITCYKPDMEALDRLIERLISQVGHIVCVNNNVRSELALIDPSTEHKLTCLQNDENNLASAQNMGIRHAREQGFGWVLLLDDDSLPAEDMVTELLNAYDQYPENDTIGLIAPHVIDRYSSRTITCQQPAYKIGFRTVMPEGHRLIPHVISTIASGSLIPVSVFDRVGLMDESYVIDYIDKEFCLRLKKHKLMVMIASHAVMEHAIGRSQDHHFLGQRITTTNHSPVRRYYIYRNRLRTWARALLYLPCFITYDLLSIGYDLLRITLYENDKWQKMEAIGRGVVHALIGKQGQDNQFPLR